MKIFRLLLDTNGRNTYAREQSDSIFSGVVGTTAQTITVPAGANYVLFSSPGSFAAKVDGTAVYPSGNIASGGSELNPTILYIAKSSTISVISNIDTEISISFYA